MLPASASPLRRGPDAYHRPPMTDTIPPPGLSSGEAAVRRLRHGANVLAASVLHVARPHRTLTAEQRATLVRLHDRCSGMVWCLVALALRYYSVEVA